MKAVMPRNILMKITDRMRVIPVLAFVVAYALAFSVASDFGLSNSRNAAPASQLIYDFVEEKVEAELSCDYYKQCLHIEVIDSTQCKENIRIRMGFIDTLDRYITREDVIVPSPKFSGEFVLEVGSNMRAKIGTFGVLRLMCSQSAPNVIASS